MAERLFDHLTIDGDEAKLDGAVIKNLENNSEFSELKSGFSELYNTAYVTDSASGGIAHFEDGANDVPLKSLKVTIEPVQSGSGDPSPSNVRPISGWTGIKVTRAGKNLLPFEIPSNTLGLSITKNADGTISITGAPSSNGSVYFYNDASHPIIIRESAILTLGVNLNADATFILGTSSTTTAVQVTGQSANIPAGEYISCRLYVASNKTYNLRLSPMIRLASDTDGTYEPYNGATYDVSLSSAGTVYGGTLDVTMGEFVVDKVLTTITDSISFNGLYTASNGVKRLVSSSTAPSQSHAIACDKYLAYYQQNNISDSALNAIAMTSDGRYVITSSLIQTATTAEEAKSALFANGNIQLVYELAAPITYNLTPTEVKSLLGINNVWSDAGDVEVEYRADTKLYIKRLTDSDTDMIADDNIVSGQYFMIGNNLYKATANIASGASVIVGTNATRKSLSEALNEINA